MSNGINYITREQFLNQSEKVQDSIREWLENNMQEKEWVTSLDANEDLWVDSVLDTRNDDINIGRVFYLGNNPCWTSIYCPDIVPLLQMHQLVNFIEDKENSKIEMDIIPDYGYSIYLYGNDGKYKYDKFERTGLDLLQALWQVVCKIAEDKQN